jgi:hypothetical protein
MEYGDSTYSLAQRFRCMIGLRFDLHQHNKKGNEWQRRIKKKIKQRKSII